MRIERTKSKCSECSLNGETRVWGISSSDQPKIVFVGEAPGEQEARQGEPFVGPAGKLLRKAASEAGMNWPTVYKMNCISCRPPKNKIGSFEGQDALEQCRPGFDEEAAHLDHAKVIVPLGNTACGQLGINTNISKARGSIYEVEFGGKIVPAVPTLHPSYIIRGGEKEFPTLVNDLMKAMRIAREGYKPPKEDFELFPTLEFLELFVEEVEEERPLLGVDIETSGFNPETNEILMIGFAESGESAVVIPFVKKGGGDYWSKDELPKVKEYVQRLLNVPTMFQNALFDVRQLRAKGYEVSDIRHDTMLLHHAIHPELPHNLGYIVSIYGETPYWKGEMLDNMKNKMDVDDATFRTYNARDAVVMHQILPAMLEDLADSETESTYRISMDLIQPILEMIENGLPISSEKLESFKKKLEHDITEYVSNLYEMSGASPWLNIDSKQDLAYLLFGAKPASYQKAKKELLTYDEPGSRKKKNTKKYRELLEKVEKVENTGPFGNPRGWKPNKTEGGAPSTDEEGLLSMKQAAVKRIDDIEKLKRPTEDHDREKDILDRLIKFLDMYRGYAETYKLHSTYTKFPIGNDGRVHGSYLIHGTASGRLCVHPETLVRVPGGKERLCDLKQGDWVYSFDADRELCLRRVAWVGPTKRKPTLTVYTDEGPPLTVSHDHLLRKWRGEWVHAKDLRIGDRLLCMPKIGDHEGYDAFFPHSRNRGDGPKGGGRVLVHRWIWEQVHGEKLRGNSIIHHIDGNPKNNHPANLKWLKGYAAHVIEHSYQNHLDLLKRAVTEGIGKTGKPLSLETVRKYRARLRRNHRVTAIESGPEQLLWDLEVEDTHCFIGNDVALHNSSRKPNMQNIPKEAKPVFIVKDPDETTLIQADYSNLELRVLAVISEDDVLQAIFNRGENVHDNNTRLLFGIDTDHPKWKEIRRAAKVYIFGRNYGGTLRGVYQKVVKEVPDVRLTWQRFQQIDNTYRSEHPRYAAWYDRTVEEVLSTRKLRNAFGRLRIFLGTDSEVMRAGLNFPIQSTAADILNINLIKLKRYLGDGRSAYGNVKLIGTVHDSILFECEKRHERKVAELSKTFLEAPVEMEQGSYGFPVDVEAGPSWGDLHELEV